LTLEIQQLIKREVYGSFINPVSGIGGGVLCFDIMMKYALCIDFRSWQVHEKGSPNMFKSITIMVLLSFGIAAQISFAENIEIKSDIKDGYGKPVMQTGILTKPEGNGPFPAVVLLHGCGGIQDGNTRSEAWSKRLVNWGYTTLQVDSFGPRGVKSVCDKPGRLIPDRARDAYNAKSFL